MQRFLLRLENSRKYRPDMIHAVRAELAKSAEQYGTAIKNLRISDAAIEFDIFSSDEQSRNKTIDKLSGEFGRLLNQRDLLKDSDAVSKEEMVRIALELFNEQRYWECHETLEQAWRKEKGSEKSVQQGIILAASALVHFQKNENEVCLGMILRALAKLDNWEEEKYYAFDVDRLKRSLTDIERTKRIFNPKI
ncbi:MAG: DUF309 domain-containing protein [Nitrososphaerales archaeon]